MIDVFVTAHWGVVVKVEHIPGHYNRLTDTNSINNIANSSQTSHTGSPSGGHTATELMAGLNATTSGLSSWQTA